ncbi:TlyA family RNA methyltransferase [Synechococcus bigranulatus str. 'Rupite']|uniref:TlyA family RNA methyltransferase n=1 Tax=Thermostichus vulcanus str. 'Rupite' TaxID=2813851 RepID=A0ABT0C6P2_THEVL|nr:TlyA family RNA methyltransferase [Thermostichus vulcanus str. 'Rupite']
MANRVRLDSWLVERGYFASRQQAQRSILAGEVFLNGMRAEKTGAWVNGDPTVQIQSKPAFVSRGGEKLQGALEKFPVQVQDRICLDAGISTGGFTDCLLQRGAKQVYGVDVGYGQLAWSLRTDARVILKERVNLRYLQSVDLYGTELPHENWPDLAVVDLSFIALAKVLDPLWNLLRSPREALLLVKPQFEAGREQVGKKGVVRDPAIHAQVIEAVIQSALAQGWHLQGYTWSPITGPAGNIEYWLWLAEQDGIPVPGRSALQQMSEQAKIQLDA